jgi:hypothetical protein
MKNNQTTTKASKNLFITFVRRNNTAHTPVQRKINLQHRKRIVH